MSLVSLRLVDYDHQTLFVLELEASKNLGKYSKSVFLSVLFLYTSACSRLDHE